MKRVYLLLVSFLLIGLVSAAYGANIEANSDLQLEKGNQSENKTRASSNDSSGIGQALNQIVRTKITELKEGNYTDALGQELNVKQISADLRELRSDGFSAKTRLNITLDESNNKTKLKVNLSNGKQAEIKIMPDRASQTALERLRLKVCSAENNCTVELKEVGVGNEAKATYNVKAEKDVKVLWLFKAKMNIEANVNAETGEVISSKVPWWSSISSD